MQGASRKVFVLFGVAFAFVLAAATWTYRLQRESLREHVVAKLSAISRLKIERLADWRRERLVDATLLVNGPTFADTAKAWLSTAQERDRSQLLTTLREFASYKGCDDVVLTRDDGSVALAVSGHAAALSPGERAALRAALRQRRASFIDVDATSLPDEAPRADVVAPIFDDADASHPAVAALVLRTNAASALAGLMKQWPSPDATGDFVLARRDGDDALVLGPLRMHDGASHALRMPLSQTARPAVMAVAGLRGAFEGQDHRGVDVVAVLDAVPDSPWLLVTKLDAKEAFAPWRLRADFILGTTLAVLGALGALLGLVHQRQEKASFQALHASEKARRRADERYRLTLLSIGDGVIATDVDGRVELLSPSAEELTGWRQDEARGRPIEDVFRIEHESTRIAAKNPIREALHSQQQVLLANHTVLLAKDGTERPVADSGSPMRDETGELTGAVLVFRDQTRERARERALLAERRNLEALLSSSPVALLVVDEAGRVERANRATERLVGKRSDALVGSTLGEVLGCPSHSDEAPGCGPSESCGACELRTILQAAFTGDRANRECVLEIAERSDPRGGRSSVRIGTAALQTDGPPRAVVALWDITQQQRAAEERKALEAQLAEAMRIESIGRLAGGIAHDFNNLLAIVIANVDLALGALAHDAPVRADLLEIRSAGERAARLTRQLLAFGRKQTLQPRSLVVNKVIEDVRGLLRSAAGEAVDIRVELARDLALVRADPQQLEQALINLVVNARDAMPEGGVVTIRTANLTLAKETASGLAPGAYVTLTIDDTGCGMDEATRARIFEPFFTTKPIGKGTGLGLASVHGIVAQSGGAITVRTAPGRGASFELLLPATGAAKPSSAPPPRMALPVAAARHARVLVVEDEPAVRSMVARVLESAGYEVMTSASGPEALALCEREALHLDVLVTDVVMPAMNGRELAERVLSRWSNVGVVFMSGYADDVLDARGPVLAAARFVGKPFASHALVDAVRQVLGEREERALDHEASAAV